MKQSFKWDQKTIEDQLKKMPKIKDLQDKDALYERIQEKLQEEQLKPRKGKSRFLPVIATAAVFFLLLLIVPSFLNNNEENLTIEEAEDQAGIMMDINEVPSNNEASMERTELAPETQFADDALNSNYFGAVQTGGGEGKFLEQLVTIALPVHYKTGEFVIPVTVLAEGTSKLERFMTAKDTFFGQQWGLGSFPPMEINSVTEENSEVVVIDFSSGSLESISSTNDSLYQLILTETFAALGYNEIRFTSDGEPGVFWGQQGPIQELVIPEVNRGYYLFESNTEHQFLVKGRTVEAQRSTDQQASFQETLELMKTGDSEKDYFASIPEEVVITNIEQNNDNAIITFAEGVIVEDKLEYQIMLEAIMFAARDFGIQFIEFEGIEIDQIGPYTSSGVIEIPEFMNFIR